MPELKKIRLIPETRNPQTNTASIPRVRFALSLFRLFFLDFLLVYRFLWDIERGKIPITDRGITVVFHLKYDERIRT